MATPHASLAPAPARRRIVGWSLAATGLLVAALAWLGLARPAAAAWVWVEGEKSFRSTMVRFPQWYDQVKREQLSGGDFISHWSERGPGEASYRVDVRQAGSYELWVRANPTQAKLAYRLDNGPWTPIDLTRDARDTINIAADGKVDLRFLAWVRVGQVTLKAGGNVVAFRMSSENHNHGALDCFVLSSEPFTPDGVTRPNQIAARTRQIDASNRGWSRFDPPADPFAATSAIDLRSLNEPRAGDGGVIAVKDGRFVHSKTGRPVRFWAVNGPPAREPEALRQEARLLAKRGVNLVRIHQGYWDATGKLDPAAIAQAAEIVEAMKGEGIYSHFSIYFPLALTPAPNTPWLPGYNGRQNPFAALMFNPDFQAKYRDWWRALLTAPHPRTGRRLVDDPAVAGLEIQNEDSFFFWTFTPQNIPDPELRLLEARFGRWLAARHGSIQAALKAWGNGTPVDRDRPAEGRMGFRPLWNMANDKTARDRDTVRFLADVQRDFYQETYDFLRSLGFKGVITASNWTTASPEVLGPIEKFTYGVTDFIDRHGYFAGKHEGDNSAWSIREGHVYADRSALRFDAEVPGKPRVFNHPSMDVKYDGKPSMISETTWNRPNRYRTEAPLYFAAYGALQGSDAIVQFALDGTRWSVKPAFYMQPWTLMAPSQMGQFPAAALIYRKGLVAEGDLMADLKLPPRDLFDLKGTPLPQDAALDELRAKDVPLGGGPPRAGQRIDPLVHLVGRTAVRFRDDGPPSAVKDLRPYIDRAKQTVASSHGQLKLDYGKGLLTINAPSAQGLSGNLRAAGATTLTDLAIDSPLELGHIVAVSLDDEPLARSTRILLQVMTEEKSTEFRVEPAAGGLQKIVSLGRDPWLIKDAEGTVTLRRPDAARLTITPLDPNGTPLAGAPRTNGPAIKLRPDVIYYLIEAAAPAAAAR